MRVRVPRRGCIGAPTSAPRPAVRAALPAVLERSLLAFGADRAFTDSVLGDLAEEYALRAARDGVGAARWWYAREAVRSAPYVVRSWLRYVIRHDRGRLVRYMAGFALTSFVVALAVTYQASRVPARLSIGASDTVVVNNESPVRLPVSVLDAAGHTLDRDAPDARFRWLSGASVSVSARGEVTCRAAGDARVRVMRGPLSRDVDLLCRPIRGVTLDGDLAFLIAGDSARDVTVRGVGLDGEPVARMAGTIAVRDSDVVSLDGLRVRPLAPGITTLRVTAGDHSLAIPIIVHERVRSPEALRPDQVFVSELRLPAGAERSWPLAPGLYTIALGTAASDEAGHTQLVLATRNANCVPASNGQRYMCVALRDAAVVVYAPRIARQETDFAGRLLVLRYEN